MKYSFSSSVGGFDKPAGEANQLFLRGSVGPWVTSDRLGRLHSVAALHLT